MKFSSPAGHRTRTIAAALAVSAALVVTACSSDEDEDAPTSSATSAPTTTEQQDALPTAAELGDLLNRALDPELPVEEKAATVQDGAEAGELFAQMTQAVQDSGATFAVVDPVLPGDTPEIALATATLTLPEQEPITVDNAEFVKQDGEWKISRAWACTLVGQVAEGGEENLPVFCGGDPAPAPEAQEEVPAEEPAPVEEAPAPGPAPEAAPAPAGDEGIRSALLAEGVDQATADKLAANPDATVAAAVRMGIPQATADQFRSDPQGAMAALRGAGIDPVTAAPQLAAQL
ncbi:hypothetical protein [Corynebacterium sp.]|jgi:hypothetical protein|uniref:hypothetical protein n=1 Tax=Corynebacterium sp. TaxID=1720 RepID=UPI0025BC8004|nr:hypothetical protein [Corynebacterium sp.]